MQKNNGIIRYIFRTLALTAFAIVVVELLSFKEIIHLPLVFRLIPPFIFCTSSILFHNILLNSIIGRPQRFVGMFTGILGLKMLLHIMTMLFVALLYPATAVHFIAVYAVYYLVFTIFEVVNLMPMARGESAK